MKSIRRLFFLVIFILVIAGVVSVWYMRQQLPVREVVDVEIPSGTTLQTAMKILRKKNAVSYPVAFQWGAKIYSAFANKRIVAGYYRFNSTTTHWQALLSLFTGKQAVTVNVVFPEGIMLDEFASIASRQIGLDSVEFMRLATSDSLVKAREIPGKSVEGYLMPDTYNFFWKQRPADVLNRLLDAQEKIWRGVSADAENMKKSRLEVLTMASIVEAETPLTDEKKSVAGLYYNRLEKGMKLEADPTVQFALGSQRKLTYKDLETDNSYNTYRNTGLPPGPINSPGKAAIEAAIHPEKHDYLFFVAAGDGSGGHIFSKNFAEHKKAVALYRKRRAAQ